MVASPETVPEALGEFRISAVLGRGGSGIVYDATWGPRRVALKVLHTELAGTERVRSQFLSEAKALQAITHPSVVKVLAVGQLPDARPYLAMERLDGESLASALARGPIALAPALALFAELCEAVGALHAQGLVHRDLKPENVFIVSARHDAADVPGTGGHAVLLDLGIAKEVAAPASTTTIDGGVRGTPAYMAPERFFGQTASVATDIYELAVTLYAMLAGQLPWEDLADPEARLSPRPLVEVTAQVPVELDIEIRRALSTRAQNRPTSAADFGAAVRAAAGQDAAAPAPAETARMRPATGGADGRPTVTAERQAQAPKAWFAERQHTTDRGKTPLAWAPSEAEVAPPPPPPKRRWPFIAGGLAVAAIAGGVAWWRLSDGSPATPPAPIATITPTLTAKNDPWGANAPIATQPEREPRTIVATGEGVTVAVARTEIAHAMTRIPADSRVLVTANVGELRRDSQFDGILGKLAKYPQVKQMLEAAPCVTPILAGSEWVVFATESLTNSERGTLIVRGRWKRADIESCLADDMIKLDMPDGQSMLQLRRVGWLDFIDDHTVYISVREDLAAAQVHALVKNGAGGTAHLRELAKKLPATRTLGVAVDGDGRAWPSEALPKGSDLATWFRVSGDGSAVLDVAVDAKDAAAAQKLVDSVHATVDPVFKDADQRVGSVVVRREKATLLIAAKLSPLMIGMISSAVP